MLLCTSEQHNFWLYSCHSASYICSILEAYSSSVAVQWNEQNHHHCLSVGEFLSLSHNITGCFNPLLSRFFLTGCPTFLESKKHEASNPWTISSSNHVHKKKKCYNLSCKVPVCPIHLSQFWVSLWAEKQTNSWKMEPDKFWHKYITLRLDPPFIILITLRFGQARLDCQSEELMHPSEISDTELLVTIRKPDLTAYTLHSRLQKTNSCTQGEGSLPPCGSPMIMRYKAEIQKGVPILYLSLDCWPSNFKRTPTGKLSQFSTWNWQ